MIRGNRGWEHRGLVWLDTQVGVYVELTATSSELVAVSVAYTLMQVPKMTLMFHVFSRNFNNAT